MLFLQNLNLATIFLPEVFYSLGTILALIMLDVALGILLAIVTGTWSWQKLPSFLRENILPYLGTLTLLALFAVQPALKALFLASAAFVAAKFLADIKDKVGRLIGGSDSPAPPAVTGTR